jgi:tetratricopeptide (TPR) repeat protein
MAILLVTGGIGWAGWICLESVQKHEGKLKSYDTAPGTPRLEAHRYEMIKKDEDNAIVAGQLSPIAVVEESLQKLDGSEVDCNKGIRVLDRKEYTGAIAYFTEVLKLIPQEARKKKSWSAGGHIVDKNAYTAYAYEQRSYCYLNQKKYKAAIFDLTEAIKLRPRYCVNFTNRAKAYYLIGEKGLAAADITTARSLPPITTRDAYP